MEHRILTSEILPWDRNSYLSYVFTRPQGYKLFSCSTQLSTKFILLINFKMPKLVCILTFISMINTTSEKLKARNFFFVGILAFMSSRNFLEHEKSFITSGLGSHVKSDIIMLCHISTYSGTSNDEQEKHRAS